MGKSIKYQCFWKSGFTGDLVLFGILLLSGIVPTYTYADDNQYFATWELQQPGTHKLIWYYETKKDFDNNKPNKVTIGKKEFLVRPDVRPPTINGWYLLEYYRVKEGEAVLDIGTGTGIHAIFAADKASHVVATDIYEPAVVNARINAELNGVDGKIDFRIGDLFEPINAGEKFDVFFININFPFAADDSPRKRLHERIFSEIRQYMNPGARIYFQTSFIKTIPFILDMLNRNHFRIMEMHTIHMVDFNHEPLFMMIQSD